ncbi:hypothetical protein BC938DRAFT_471190 [Jimgerdemannia flammicorona]|uniref:Uncharacterized protein n=1 Tax=Jimgerdemannia flammicorona TaxID=994334 RepID=A0A433Q8N3_9FUNG|nr:hypothetical protein BC938DRAFT_471190 [Jimgerdemannia flammicorona]
MYKQVQQLVSSQERRCEDQDSDGRTRIGQKTNLIIDLSTGPRFEGFVVRFREVYPRVVPKIWTDEVKIMVGMRDMINRIIKTYTALPPKDYMKVLVFGCQVVCMYISNGGGRELCLLFWCMVVLRTGRDPVVPSSRRSVTSSRSEH